MLENLAEFLFKYRPVLFQEGEVHLAAPAWVWILGTGLVLSVLTAGTYRMARGRSSRRDRIVLTALRSGILGLLLFAILKPTLVLSRVIPERNFVGILVDDSRSMRIDDGSGIARADVALAQVGLEEGSLRAALDERFGVRVFRFSDVVQRIDSLSELGFSGRRTDLAAALDFAREELAGVPLSGLVLLSDGANNGDRPLQDALLPLKAAGVPVFTVGIGEESLPTDIQVSRVETPREVLRGTSVVVDVVVTHSGYTGRHVPLIVEDDGQVVSTQDVELGRSGEPTTVRVHFQAAERGPRTFRFRVPVQDDERVAENNAQDALVQVQDATRDILFFEGVPRPELTFVDRYALQGDANIRGARVTRTADAKYLRQNVRDSVELQGGFPKAREVLFDYDAIVLGTAEASEFTSDQLQMVADFVSERGGGLLVAGGKRSLAEGGFVGTPLEDVLPVELEEPVGSEPTLIGDLAVRPTRAGAAHPITQIVPEGQDVTAAWESLPTLTSYNPVRNVKPGATALLTAPVPDGDQVVLAFHRYGRGKALVFTPQDSWQWQMGAEVPVDDLRFETFWRQLLRWLVDGVPERVEGRLPSDRVEPGRSVLVQAVVSDSGFVEMNGAEVTAQVTTPSGEERSAVLDWTVERDGLYAVDLPTDEPGLYRIALEARRDDSVLGQDTVYVRAEESQAEFFDSGMKASVLQRVAQETGGRFYTPETVSRLAEDLQYTGGGVTQIEEEDLWDMPVLFLALLLLIGAEWGFRRVRELA
ncbi:MAG: glutamine amidotransferase [Gemmatimonadota bacterium]